MADLGLLRFQPASELREEEERMRVSDEETRRKRLLESSLEAHIHRSWEENKRAKTDIEHRLYDCLRRRKGEYDPSKLAAIREEGGSEIYMMLTATKCRAAAAWLRDILMPANERPWGLDPTPVSQVPDAYLNPVVQQLRQQAMQAQQQGQQIDTQQLVDLARERIRNAAQEAAEKAAELHEKLIEDQLAEGGWDEALESFIDDFVTYPTAFMRSPILRNVPTLQWLEGWQPVKGYEIRPESQRVSPHDIYPSPDSTTIDDGSNIIEVVRFRRADITQMRGLEGYDDERIDEVLREYGEGGLHNWLWRDAERERLEGRDHEMFTSSQTIEGLIYWGSAQGVTLLQWGVDPDEVPDPLGDYEVEAILIGSYVIKVRVNKDPLGRRPYHKASFQPVPGSFWGISIPELMADIQDVCNATARGLVNNLSISSGPQVEVYEDRLQPGEDPTSIYPWKLWRTRDSAMTSNNPAVRFYQPTSNAGELLTVYEQFERRADDATNIPRYIYGNQEVGGAGQTASGLSMLMESANKGIKDAIRHIDRGVIRRVIEAHWLHNMQYSDDDSIKGDASVVPRGSSAMLIREQTNQLRTQFLQMTANEFDMAILGKEGRRKLLDKVAGKLDMPSLIPSEEDLSNQDAQAQKIQQLEQQLAMAERQAKIAVDQGKAAESQAKIQKTQAEVEETQVDSQATAQEAQIAREIAPLEAQKLLAEIMTMLRRESRDDRRATMEVNRPAIPDQRGGGANRAPAPSARQGQGPARGLA